MCYYNYETIERLIQKYDPYAEDYASEYGEPGYTRNFPNLPIYFANWNKVPKKVMRWLEERIDYQWSDEWLTAEGAGGVWKAYRTQPDCWQWKPSFLCNDWTNGEVIGFDVFEENESLRRAYVEEYLLNDPNVCDQLDLNLGEFDFEAMEELESGWYGTNDSPREVMERYQEKYPDYDFVFGGMARQQFATYWNIYGRKRV